MDRTEITNASPSNILSLPIVSGGIRTSFGAETDQSEQGPIELKMREALTKLKETSYNDTFDWGVYDKIAAKFGNEPPRGGVIFNTTLKLVNHHSSCSKCLYAFELDTWGRGCAHNCTYCYAKEILTRHGYWNRPHAFPVNLAEIRKIFYTVFETDKSSPWRDILEKRVPLRLGSMSDSFSWVDRKYGVTKELLKILSHYRYPYIVFTRSDLVATDEYMALLDKKLASVQFSISGGNEKLTKKLEPGAPPVGRRLEALRKLADAGFWTTVRINPLFLMFPDGYFTDEESIRTRFGSKEAAPKFDLFDWDFIATLKEYKVPSVLAGVVRLTPFAIREISKAIEMDFSQFFKPDNFNKSADSKFSDKEIAYYYRRIAQECFKNRIRFSTCYIGNGVKDFYQYQSLWTNKKDCCDAIGNVASFNSSSQDISWETRAKFAPSAASAADTQAQEAKVLQEFQQRPMITAPAGPSLELTQ